ncbi:hypothetical protein L873DRAFT_425561 [Choiromyces venosus 120613-1]|uniref:F-box domain-containing protein n=1 Tax=Choiromyces venosus 120613-1 TaxID=1336337 RepID=A0A3N4K2L6_9PEZI|nr:hypothetical protein L873DRAFT_425561 [Choiromyces venosus 120613-1]
MKLPVEIVDQIMANLVEKKDLAAAALVSRACHRSATPLLYRDIVIEDVLDNNDTRELPTRGVQKRGSLPQMTSLISTLHSNPFICSLVCSIEHQFYIAVPYVDSLQRQIWEMALITMRVQLQKIIDRNGFSRVTQLRLFNPDVEFADILLKGLLPQIEVLHIASPYVRHLPFNGSLPSNIKELQVQFLSELLRIPGPTLFGDVWQATRAAYNSADETMHSHFNSFLSASPSLQILRISGTKELHAILADVTFPSLDILEIGPVFNRVIDLTVAGLSSFIDRHPGISRLALRNLPAETDTVLSISPESRSGIRQLISCVEEIPTDYYSFLDQFEGLDTFKMHRDIVVGGVLQDELLELVKHLQRDGPGIKNLALPMPSHISGRTLTDSKLEMARVALEHFGQAFKQYLPGVEVFGISQIGRYNDLGSVDWSRSFAGHPCLKRLAIKTPFLPNFRESHAVRENVIDDLARAFSDLPALEKLVFYESIDKQAIELEIIRGETTTGKERFVDTAEVDAEFFDYFFQTGWEKS